MPNNSDPTLAEVGEFGVIAQLVEGRRYPPGVRVGPGDDAAVVDAPDGRVVVTTDMLVQDRHFRLDWATPNDVGRRAIAQNAADIEAMGAQCTGFVVAFGAPSHTSAAAARDFADGLWQEATLAGAAVVGGDLVASPQWVVSVTALGDLGGRDPVLLSGARPGSVIAVTGTLGHSAVGLALRLAGVGGFDDIARRFLVPEVPYGQGRAAAQAGAQAMTDISDGLLADLGHIADASAVTLDLDAAALRADVELITAAAQAAASDPWPLLLAGGEDHALAACFSGEPPPGWRVIGTVRAGPAAVLVDGRPWTGATGWQSFEDRP